MRIFFSLKLLLLVMLHACINPSLQNPSCNDTEIKLLSKAFAFVSGFRLSLPSENCSAATEIRLSSRNLKGTVSWNYLREISGLRILDLSGNSLSGSIPSIFWSAPSLTELNLAGNRLGGPIGVNFSGRTPSSLRSLNLSGNRFTNSIELSAFRSLRFLDLSENNLRAWPSGLSLLSQLKYLNLSRCNISGDGKILAGASSIEYLDISQNRIRGSFPDDLPQLAGIKFLNISFNLFTGKVTAEDLGKFGSSAFLHSGVDLLFSSSSSSLRHSCLVWGTCLSAGILFVFALIMVVRRKGYKCIAEKNKDLGPEDGERAEVFAVGGDSTVAAVPVAIFEKPWLRLTFLDLAVSTSGFGEESKLAGGGAVYRAVLPGDLDVVIKTVNRSLEQSFFEGLRHLKHPNILPLLGFCAAGKEMMMLYEYMANGDLRRWLQELPAYPGERRENDGEWGSPKEERERLEIWSVRHKIALGIARGLAFLHHGRSQPFIHGNLVASKVLLDEDLEPKIAGIEKGGKIEGSPADDVYSYGLILVELMTGKEAAPPVMTAVGRLIRGEDAERCLDGRLRSCIDEFDGGEAEKEMVETLRLALLCAAESPEKRPTMKQVVGLIKDVRRIQPLLPIDRSIDRHT